MNRKTRPDVYDDNLSKLALQPRRAAAKDSEHSEPSSARMVNLSLVSNKASFSGSIQFAAQNRPHLCSNSPSACNTLLLLLDKFHE